jgi:hypothetical protein
VTPSNPSIDEESAFKFLTAELQRKYLDLNSFINSKDCIKLIEVEYIRRKEIQKKPNIFTGKEKSSCISSRNHEPNQMIKPFAKNLQCSSTFDNKAEMFKGYITFK